MQYLALKLRLKSRSRVLDVGCGIGGPMREIALFSGASITGELRLAWPAAAAAEPRASSAEQRRAPERPALA